MGDGKNKAEKEYDFPIRSFHCDYMRVYKLSYSKGATTVKTESFSLIWSLTCADDDVDYVGPTR